MDIPSGVVSHVQLQGVTANEHHNQLHAAQHILTGNDALSVVFRQEDRKFKSSSQTVTNSTTLVDDPELQWSVKAGVRYGFELHAYIAGGGSAGFRGKLLTASSMAGRLVTSLVTSNAYIGSVDVFPAGFTWTFAAGTNQMWWHCYGILVPSADDLVKVQWSQGVADVTTVTFNAQSHGMMFPW